MNRKKKKSKKKQKKESIKIEKYYKYKINEINVVTCADTKELDDRTQIHLTDEVILKYIKLETD